MDCPPLPGRGADFAAALDVSRREIKPLRQRLGGDWTVTCAETHAVGWMDCGGQPDARWRAEALPGWVDIEHLVAAAVAGSGGVVVAAGLAVAGSPWRQSAR